MKKTGLMLLVTAIGMVGMRAQAQSNTLLVYGNVSFDSQKVGSATASSYSFAPGVGYQWDNNWTGGISFALNGTKDAGKTSALAVGPFVRYTYPLGDIFAVYGQFNADYLSGKTNNTKSNGFRGTLFPAIGVNLKNSFALNFTFGSLNFTSQKIDGVSEPANSFHASFGNGVGFGMSKNFGAKK